MIRRFDEAVVAGRRYRWRPGAFAVIRGADGVLLTLKDGAKIQLPGGGLDEGEQPLAALHREVFEETGWRIAVIRRLGAWRRFTWAEEAGAWAEKLCAVYLARPVLRLGPPGDKAHTPFWAPPELAPRLVATRGERHFLRMSA